MGLVTPWPPAEILPAWPRTCKRLLPWALSDPSPRRSLSSRNSAGTAARPQRGAKFWHSTSFAIMRGDWRCANNMLFLHACLVPTKNDG